MLQYFQKSFNYLVSINACLSLKSVSANFLLNICLLYLANLSPFYVITFILLSKSALFTISMTIMTGFLFYLTSDFIKNLKFYIFFQIFKMCVIPILHILLNQVIEEKFDLKFQTEGDDFTTLVSPIRTYSNIWLGHFL